jgi:hypothetical protein
MTTEKLIELVGIWFTGIATLSATLVALFLPKLYRPRLSVSCNKDGIGSSSYVIGTDSGASAFEDLWIKIGVKNRGSMNAEDVQLRLIMAHNTKMSGRRGYRLFSSWWLKVSALNAVSISIPPKYTQYYDLCYIVVRRNPGSTSLYLAAVRPPMDEWNLERKNIENDPHRVLKAGCVYNIVFAVSGKNTHASYWQISLAYDIPTSPESDQPSEATLRRAIQVGSPKLVSRQIELDAIEAV